MKSFGAVVALLFAFLGLFVISVLFGPIIGFISGWIIAGIIPEMIVAGFSKFGISIIAEDIKYIGAALGFIGGFFKASQISSKD